MAGKDLSPILNNSQASVREEMIYHTDWEFEIVINRSAEDVSAFKNPARVRALRDRIGNMHITSALRAVKPSRSFMI
jgi:hypothetical protein